MTGTYSEKMQDIIFFCLFSKTPLAFPMAECYTIYNYKRLWGFLQ